MSDSTLLALVGPLALILGAAIGVLGQLQVQKTSARRDVERQREAARQDAEAVLARYREPLISAVVDLQYSIYNILQEQFLWRLVHENQGGRSQVAMNSTLFNFAQYFGWREVLRLESQLLEFEEIEETREVDRLLKEITNRFSALNETDDESCRLFKAEQRAIGELMLAEHDGRTVCAGYAAFVSERRQSAGEWLDKLEADLRDLSATERPAHDRLTDIQHLLVELAVRLDHRGVRQLEERLKKA